MMEAMTTAAVTVKQQLMVKLSLFRALAGQSIENKDDCDRLFVVGIDNVNVQCCPMHSHLDVTPAGSRQPQANDNASSWLECVANSDAIGLCRGNKGDACTLYGGTQVRVVASREAHLFAAGGVSTGSSDAVQRSGVGIGHIHNWTWW